MKKNNKRIAINFLVLSMSVVSLWSRESGEGYGSDFGYGQSQVLSPNPAFKRGNDLLKEGKFPEALAQFEEAVKTNPEDPDALNMLAYTQRKLGKLDDAFNNYKKALMLKPVFPQAREYLGEAYLQALIQQLDILKGYGSEGEKDYNQLLKAFKEAAGKFK